MGLNLRITAVQKRYNGKVALEGCSFGFSSGGIYALMGPNGSGKSTLLRVCSLLEPVDSGDIIYTSGSSVCLHGLSLKRKITLVLPRIGLFNTTVFKNVAYGLKVRGMAREDIVRNVDTALDAVGLLHKSRQNALTLSSGEAQRIGVARAMVIEPEVLFLDEPTASIDEENTAIVERIILGLKSAGKTTVIISTHDRDQAERLAARVVLMQSGKIV